jgi:hypothetical protein
LRWSADGSALVGDAFAALSANLQEHCGAVCFALDLAAASINLRAA